MGMNNNDPKPVAGVEFNPTTEPKMEITERVTAARAAMAGPERLAREAEALNRQTARRELEEIKNRLNKISKEKEALELNWIHADDKRRALALKLTPLLDEEKKWEEEESKIELAEAKSGLPAEKQKFESDRWLVQEKRRAAEEKKWAVQKDLAQVETLIEGDTKKYRDLLDEEDRLKKKEEELSANLI